MSGRFIPPAVRDWVQIVVEDNADDLLRYLRRRVNQPEDAADLLARVFLAVWEKSARLPTTDLDARLWCFGIARNILREHHRHAMKQLALADGLRDHLRTSASAHAGADTVAETKMNSEAVRQGMSTLDSRSRELIMLIHWDGFSIADAARILSVVESTARTQHARALKRLRQQLQDDGFDSADRHEESVRGLINGPGRQARQPDPINGVRWSSVDAAVSVAPGDPFPRRVSVVTGSSAPDTRLDGFMMSLR